MRQPTGRLTSVQRHGLVTAAEASLQKFRDYDDQVSVTEARLATTNIHGASLRGLKRGRTTALKQFAGAVRRLPGSNGSGEPARAISTMRSVLSDANSDDSDESAHVDDDYDPEQLARQEGVEALEDRIYACFGHAAEDIEFQGRHLDRLEILDLLPLTEDPEKRKALFMALEPVWKAVNRDDRESSPYRVLVQCRSRAWTARTNPLHLNAKEARVTLPEMESWIVAALETWRSVGPPRPVEPWDFPYATGVATRELSRRVPSLRRMESVRDRYYRVLLGTEPSALGVHFDLEPREGKDPVAYTTFGTRNCRADGTWKQGEFWVFAAYEDGNLDNLYELVHETGHAVHIAGIHTRPAFQDFPDSDAFTEALADLIGLEVYEPEWQRRFLGAETTLVQSLQDKYSSMMMDLAWGLFEIRMYHSPTSDPNQVWTDITRKHLNIKPHPELSWWAVRGQLIDAPGYMLTYALGDFMAAALRDRTKALHGDSVFWNPPPGLYPWLTERLYRFGLERTSMDVLEDFLGGPLRPDSLIRDLRRARSRRRSP